MNNQSQKKDSKPRIALWFRYGPAEHTELFHAIPDIVEYLAQFAEIHYFGMRTEKPVPERITRNATVHFLPFRVNRGSMRDKFVKALVWLACLPWVGLYCRFLKINAVYIDETIPLSATLAQLFYGPRTALTVADFFTDIYCPGNSLLGGIGHIIRRQDIRSWRKLPAIFTRAKSTRTYLEQQGVPAASIHPVYDPCDFTIYHPLPKAERQEARTLWGFNDDHIVLVHHGILHPNKGNDRILRGLAEFKDTCPNIRYLLIGDGPDMKRLRDMTEELGLKEHVVFTGWLETLQEVNEALNAGDIGLVMRVGEQSDDFHMTGALVHSMACGLPILTARLAGVAEVIHENENGCLFDPNDMQAFQQQLKRLADDPALRKRYGQSVHELAKKIFDMDSVVRATAHPVLSVAGIPLPETNRKEKTS
jgi:glycosyltransferase involved in cell wall biosynthesis